MKRTLPAATLVLAMAGWALGQDVVRLRAGTEVKGRVTAMNSKNVVVVEAGNKPTTLKSEDVASVTLGDAPSSLAKAEQAMGEGRYEKAINHYPAAIEEIAKEKKRDFHRQYILMNWAQALQAKGDTPAALAMLQKLRNECGADSFLRPESYRKSLEFAKSKGEEQVVAVLTEMKGEPDPVGSEAELELAKMKYNRGEYEGASVLFDRLGGTTTAAATEAKLWHLRCLRQLKKQSDLESLCKRILDNRQTSPPALVQAAAASMASIQFAKLDKDKSKVRDVLMICVQAIAMGPPSGKEEGEDYALALLTGARCYVSLMKEMEKHEAKDEFKQRALSYLKEVRGAYRGTQLADQADREIKSIEGEKPKEVPK